MVSIGFVFRYDGGSAVLVLFLLRHDVPAANS